MSQSRQPISVGKYFLDRGKISEEDLEQALAHKDEHGYKLGQSLVALGLVAETDLVEALRHQARFPCIHLTPGIVDPVVSMKLPEAQSRRLRAVVLNQVAEHTTIAMEDPTDVNSIAELARVLDTRIFPVYAEATAIAKVADLIYGAPPAPPPPLEAAPEACVAPRTGKARRAAQPEAAPAPQTSTPATATVETTDDASEDEGGTPDEKKVGALVRGTLQQALDQGASDIHLEPRVDGFVLRHRIDGVLVERRRVPRSWAGAVLDRIKRLSKLDTNQFNQPQDGRIQFAHSEGRVELRVSTTPSLQGEGAVLSLTAAGSTIPTLADLGLAPEPLEAVTSVLGGGDGLVLATGPTGCGKTTTLYALLQHFVGATRKVVTLEDPVEHTLDGVLQVNVDPKNQLSFGKGLRSVLNQDPDVVLVGDLRDDEACLQTVQAALTGHFVLAGVRAHGAIDAMRRLIARGIEPYLLADALRAVVDQRLLRRVCADCKTPVLPDEVLLGRLGITNDGTTYYEGEGCSQCHGTGYRGRIGIHEVTRIGARLRRLIEKDEGTEALTLAAREDGLPTLRADGLRKAREGLTTLHEVLAATSRNEP